jgi:transglutaminase-like putative cysteine protease
VRFFKYSSKELKSQRWWDWPAVMLLFAAILIAAIRLNATHWTRDLELVQTVTFFGIIAGLALGQSKFSTGTVRFFAIAYGAFVVAWQTGLTLGRGVPWLERSVSMADRLILTINQIFQQKPVTDNLFFHVLMAILFWALSVYAGYSLTRHGNPWRAILPAGLSIVIIHAYDAFFPVRAWFLAGFIFLSLLLIARLNFIYLRNQWRDNGTYLPPYIGLDSIRLGLITTVILLVLAWTVPALASSFAPAESVWRRATQPWTDIRNRLSNVFYSLQASVGVVTDFYGDTLPLGRGNPLADTVILAIEAPPRPAPGIRYYWRSRVYDYYDGTWTSTLQDSRSVEPDTFDITFPEYQSRETGEFRIRTGFSIQNLIMPSQPIWASRPGSAILGINPDGTADLSHLKANPILLAGDTYQVQASLTAASIADLRAAGEEYPDWILSRYLQLPATITPRTIDLAKEITAGLENPYDKAEIITNFLRKYLEYSGTVPSVPGNREPIDWILFDHRQAFCNYYATAEVIMLRSLGIPARLAVGYAEGELVNVSGEVSEGALRFGGPEVYLFNVRHRDAHAWPEVYFPNIGWVEFEPTVSQEPLHRPVGNANSEAGNSQTDDAQDELSGLADQTIFLEEERFSVFDAQETQGFQVPTFAWVLIAISVTMIASLTIRRIRIQRGSPPIPVQIEGGLRDVGISPPEVLRRWAHVSGLAPASRAYLEINRALVRLGQSATPADTPSERAFSLIRLLPRAEIYIRDVLSAYHSIIYSNGRPKLINTARAAKEIRNRSYQALINHILRGRLFEYLRGIITRFRPGIRPQI